MNSFAPNTYLDMFCTAAVVVMVLYNYWCMKKDKKGTGYKAFVILILLYSLFYRPAGGDFWGYLNLYEFGEDIRRHMEDVYYWLIKVLPKSYIMWRIAVWLPAAILVSITMKMLKLPSSYAVVSFLVLGLPAYYYTRNALALSILYVAIAIICMRPYKYSFWNVVLFVLLSFSSWFFHRSMPMYIAFALIALVLPFRRNYILASLIVFPILYGAIMLLARDLLSLGEIWMSDNIGMNYLEQVNNASANWKGLIRMMIDYAPVLYFYYIAFFYPINKDAPEYKAYKVFLLFCFLVFYVSFLFYGQGSTAIQSRMYKSTMIPFSFLIALYFKYFFGNKRCRIFINLLLVSIAFDVFVGVVGLL